MPDTSPLLLLLQVPIVKATDDTTVGRLLQDSQSLAALAQVSLCLQFVCSHFFICFLRMCGKVGERVNKEKNTLGRYEKNERIS